MPIPEIGSSISSAQHGERPNSIAKRNDSAPTPAARPQPLVGLTQEFMERVQAETEQFESRSRKSNELSMNLARLSQQLEEGADNAAVAQETIDSLDEYKAFLDGTGSIKVNGPWEVKAEVKAQFVSIQRQLDTLGQQVQGFVGDSMRSRSIEQEAHSADG